MLYDYVFFKYNNILKYGNMLGRFICLFNSTLFAVTGLSKSCLHHYQATLRLFLMHAYRFIRICDIESSLITRK